MSDTERGTTVVVVGDTEYTLKPSLRAARQIEAFYGGLVPAMHNLRTANIDGLTAIIAAGADVKPKRFEALAESIYQAGAAKVATQCVPFITFLLNPSHKDEEEGEGNEPEEPAP